MSRRPPATLIGDINTALSKIESYFYGMDRAAFLHDEKTIDAVVRNLQIIGEAAARLPDDFTKLNAQIEWRRIVGLRHRIVHDYFGVDRELIWQIVTADLPALKRDLATVHYP